MTINNSFSELSWLYSFIKPYTGKRRGRKEKKKNTTLYTKDTTWMGFLKRKKIKEQLKYKMIVYSHRSLMHLLYLCIYVLYIYYILFTSTNTVYDIINRPSFPDAVISYKRFNGGNEYWKSLKQTVCFDDGDDKDGKNSLHKYYVFRSSIPTSSVWYIYIYFVCKLNTYIHCFL